MSTKLKALGLAAVAALAVAAVGVVNATAETGGHFISAADNTTIVGTEAGDEHGLHFTVHNVPGEIGCNKATYHGEASAKTVTELKITPLWSECSTTGSSAVTIDTNGCILRFTVNTEPETKHNTVHVEGCEGGKPGIEITHPNCKIVIPPQVVVGAIYTNKTDSEGEYITLDSTVEPKTEGGVEVGGITTHFESFGCILVYGTKHKGAMKGSATVFGDSGGNRVDITAT